MKKSWKIFLIVAFLFFVTSFMFAGIITKKCLVDNTSVDSNLPLYCPTFFEAVRDGMLIVGPVIFLVALILFLVSRRKLTGKVANK